MLLKRLPDGSRVESRSPGVSWVHFLSRHEICTNKYISLQFPKEMNTRGSKTPISFISFHTNLQSLDQRSRRRAVWTPVHRSVQSERSVFTVWAETRGSEDRTDSWRNTFQRFASLNKHHHLTFRGIFHPKMTIKWCIFKVLCIMYSRSWWYLFISVLVI